MTLTRNQRAAFWCERTLNRSLTSVAIAVAILLETEDEKTVRETLRQRYKGMPVSIIISVARTIKV